MGIWHSNKNRRVLMYKLWDNATCICNLGHAHRGSSKSTIVTSTVNHSVRNATCWQLQKFLLTSTWNTHYTTGNSGLIMTLNNICNIFSWTVNRDYLDNIRLASTVNSSMWNTKNSVNQKTIQEPWVSICMILNSQFDLSQHHYIVPLAKRDITLNNALIVVHCHLWLPFVLGHIW